MDGNHIDKLSADNLNKMGSVTGLTKREYFAAMAMQGLASQPTNGADWETIIPADARVAVQYSDALLRELETTSNK